MNSLSPEDDAENLARYQNYAKNVINQNLNKPPTENQESTNLLDATFDRQVKQAMELKGLNYRDAFNLVNS